MKKTAIYIRVSSDRQAQEGDSIPAQRAALRKYINDRPDLSFAGEYLDDGISGTKYSQRDELQRLLDDVAAGNVELITFTRLDRWFRSVRHYTATQEILDKYNVPWIAIWEPIYDTTTPQGRLIVNQMMSIAQFESENTGQRIRHVQAYKLTQKEVISGSTPPGYSIEEKHLVPDSNAKNVLTLFETYAKTGSLNETMRQVVGLPGLPRSKPAMKRVLKNTLYIGRHPTAGDGFCEPIIPQELFFDVQRQLGMNVKCSQRHVYIFSGLIRCAECGRAFGGNTRRRQRGNGKLEEIHQYRCSWHFNLKPARCDNKKVVSEGALERHLLDNLSGLMEGAILKIEAEAAPKKDRSVQIAALERKLARLKDLYVNELISIQEYKMDQEAYIQQIEQLQTEQNRNPAVTEEAVEELRRFAEMDIKSIYAELTPQERRRFWRGIIRTIKIGKDRSIEVEFLALSGSN